METISTRFGNIEAVRVERFPGGEVKSLVPGARTELTTPYGSFTPQYEGNEERRRMIPEVSFYPNGALRNLPLQEQALVTTPLGSLPAELITFHDTGAVKRVFPMNGKLSGFWTQEDEEKLAEEQHIITPFGPVRAKFISLCFDKDGALRSLTLWSAQKINVPTPMGIFAARIGVSFHPTGEVASLEPAQPIRIKTPLGLLHAFDPDAHGVHGDHNSLCFDPQGNVVAITTVMDQIGITGPDELKETMCPSIRKSYCNEDMLEPVPMRVIFKDTDVVFQTGPGQISCFPIPQSTFALSSMSSKVPHLKMPANAFTLEQGCAQC